MVRFSHSAREYPVCRTQETEEPAERPAAIAKQALLFEEVCRFDSYPVDPGAAARMQHPLLWCYPFNGKEANFILLVIEVRLFVASPRHGCEAQLRLNHLGFGNLRSPKLKELSCTETVSGNNGNSGGSVSRSGVVLA